MRFPLHSEWKNRYECFGEYPNLPFCFFVPVPADVSKAFRLFHSLLQMHSTDVLRLAASRLLLYRLVCLFGCPLQSISRNPVQIRSAVQALIMRTALKGIPNTSTTAWPHSPVRGRVPDSAAHPTVTFMRETEPNKTAFRKDTSPEPAENLSPPFPSPLSPSPLPRLPPPRSPPPQSPESLCESLSPKRRCSSMPRQQLRIAFRTNCQTVSGEEQHRKAADPSSSKPINNTQSTMPGYRTDPPPRISINRHAKSSTSLPTAPRPSTAPIRPALRSPSVSHSTPPLKTSIYSIPVKEAWLHQTLLVNGTLAAAPPPRANKSSPAKPGGLGLRPSILDSPFFLGHARAGPVFRTVIVPSALYKPPSVPRPSTGGNPRSSTLPGQLQQPAAGVSGQRRTLTFGGSRKIDNLFGASKVSNPRASSSMNGNSSFGSRHGTMQGHMHVAVSSESSRGTELQGAASSMPGTLPGGSADNPAWDFLTVGKEQQQPEQQQQKESEGSRSPAVSSRDEKDTTDSDEGLVGPPHLVHKSFLEEIADGGPVATLKKKLNEMQKQESKRKTYRPGKLPAVFGYELGCGIQAQSGDQ